MSAARFFAPVPLLLIAGYPPQPAAADIDPAGPSYAAAAVYRLEFHGVRLGMPRDEVCRRLLANGYAARSPGGCGPLAPREFEDWPPTESYNGTSPRACRRETCDAALPSATVSYITIEYDRSDGRDVVREFTVRTEEPGDGDTLAAATIRAWGRPTYYARWAYNVLNYGTSPEQAEFYNRFYYRQCRCNPTCAERDGLDCGAILSDFAMPNAQVTTHDGFRVIEVEDARLDLRDLRASGVIHGRRVVRWYSC